MTDAPNTAGLSPRSAPAKDRPARPVPPRIAEILGIVTILAGYGRHLAATLEHRAVARGFATIAQYFGTVTLDTIQAHILRGLMRAIALERLLLLRAARGRDLRTLTPRTASCRAPAAQDAADPAPEAAPAPPETLTPEQAAAAQEAARQAAVSRAEARLARRIARDRPLTFDTLPSMEEIEAEVRRSPLGRTIALICRDLGISPSLCDGAFWGRIFDAIRLYRGSIGSVVLEMADRVQRFEKDEWKRPGLQLPEFTRDSIRRVLGFRIGEPPVDPFAIVAAPGAGVAAAATGPP